MNDSKQVFAKLVISLTVPLLIVTLGGLIVYKTFTAFFFPETIPGTAEVNGPAVIYYALTLVIALMFFLMRQGWKSYEFIAMGVMSLVYALSLQKLTPQIHRLLYLYFIPLLVFFLLMWLILKLIFLNKHVRGVRLLLFALLGSAAFTLTFRLQYVLLHQHVAGDFMQSRFMSGLMLFIFMGFGLSLADFMIMKMEHKDVVLTVPSCEPEISEKKPTDGETD
jgi:hypothetical protein